MLENIKDYIFVTNVIEKNQCESIIKDITVNNEWDIHKWQRYGESLASEVTFPNRECEVAEPTEEQCQMMNNYMFRAIKEYNEYLEQHCVYNDFIGTSGVSRVGIVRFNRYNVHSTMKCHNDHIHTLFDGSRKGIPILSIVVLLNENYEGGEFVFFKDYEIKLKTGDILIFPSNFLFPHRVCKVTKGTRFSAVTWAW
jgi:predicted 2-oxoglutarate/Fe(II)-dependent dioxygenase YbiX